MSQNKFHAMLLGGDRTLAESLMSVVRLDGGALGVVSSCVEALKFLQGHTLDIIFLDLRSAEAECLNCLRHLKQHPLQLPVFTIGFGSQGENPMLVRAFELGLNEFVQTPFENSLFRARISSALLLKRSLGELTRRQRELSEACRVAEANSRAKSDFLAAMSHEIRTPMNGVIAMTGLLMETELTPDQRSYVETIHNSSESLLNIINDILDFSKIEAGKMGLERRTFDLRAGIEETLDLLAPRAFEKKLDVVCDVADTIPALVGGDEQRLRQVLMNLVGNALKFTEQGSVVVKVETSEPVEENPDSLRLHFSVRDTGIGIPPDRLVRLFRPFSQADVSTSRKYGGTGLGLVISRRLVELMGGRTWAESMTGEGSTFHFTVNLAKVANSAPPKIVHRQPRLADLKILILEDGAIVRNQLVEQCRRWGMNPQAVENSAQAVDLLRKGATFDLALVDAQLPDLNGVTVAAEMRKIPSAALMPVVLMNAPGKWNGDDREERAKFAHTVGKPVRPGTLSAALERALQNPRPTTDQSLPSRLEAPLAERFPLRILVADDNSINLKVAARILNQLGYQPEMAANGCDALAVIERQPVDLVFMDVMMPEIDGLAATRLIRERQISGEKNFQPRIVVVAMTAHAMQGDREKCLGSGMDDYLAKPVRPKDVRAMIEKWGAMAAPASCPQPPAEIVSNADEGAVDMARLMDLTDGNMDQLRELVDMYFKQTQTQVGQMREAVRDGKADQARRVAHSCAGASATLGMTRLVPLLRELEKLGASGTLTGAGEICENIAKEFERIREFLSMNPELAAVIASLNPA
jgi:signal transduction histidine kinase/DNA-binding LytR/AlgR family response regulator/HPt (histidine-containing phosphotransfer) domain-containing protein